VIAVDGKTARGSRDRAKNRNPLHRVSAWANANRRVLGQEVTEEKSNEITAIPKLLALLDLYGCIVTIDAMGCQRALAENIVDQGGDYVLGLKGNQGALHEAVEEYFTTAQAADFKNVPYRYTEEIDNEQLGGRNPEHRTTLFHQLHRRGRQAVCPCGAGALERGKPSALAVGCGVSRR
jgi:predicted transposase YbfD/YdcC